MTDNLTPCANYKLRGYEITMTEQAMAEAVWWQGPEFVVPKGESDE